MNIHIAAHNPIDGPTPRGGEKSMRAIADHLSKNHTVTIGNDISRDKIVSCDVVATWGRPAAEVAKVADAAGKPLVLFVRFWKNIAPPLRAGGYGDLLTRDLLPGFIATRAHLFRYASAIVTNSAYSREVIKRWQPVAHGKIHVSYVPVLGEYAPCGDERGRLTIVTPEVYGERWLVSGLTKLDRTLPFHIVNVDEWTETFFRGLGDDVQISRYSDMETVWPKASILLNPIYNNDICGTRRVTIEAFRHGVPMIANDRCGISEKVPPAMLVRANAGPAEWKAKIDEIRRDYSRFVNLARRAWEKYDTAGQLVKVEKIIVECAL